jgi:hypothetical protein
MGMGKSKEAKIGPVSHLDGLHAGLTGPLDCQQLLFSF